jgi:tetratricopeptide (TPR) repeat protein
MDEAQAALSAGTALLHRREWSAALSEFDRAAELLPKVRKLVSYLVQRGTALTGVGGPNALAEALACFDAALNVDKDNGAAWFMRGRALNELGRRDEMLAAYRRAASASPVVEEAHLMLLRALLQQGDAAGAVAAGQTALPVVTKRRGALHRLFLYACAQAGREELCEESAVALAVEFQAQRDGMERGGSAGSAGDTEDAATELLDEEMTEVLGRALGRAASARGSSVRHWQLACVVEPSFEHLLGLGAAYSSAGETGAAKRCLMLSRARCPEDWRPFHHLGLNEFRARRYRNSAAYFQHALDLCSTAPATAAGQQQRRGSVVSADPREAARLAAVYREGQGRMVSRVQLYLGTALLNSGDVVGARHHVSCAAHSHGTVRNFARILLAAILTRVGHLESALNTLNIARKEFDEAVFEGHAEEAPASAPADAAASTAAAASPERNDGRYASSSVGSFGSYASAKGIGDEHELPDLAIGASNPAKQSTLSSDRALAVRLHHATALLTRVVYEDLFASKSEPQLVKLFELETSCIRDMARRAKGDAAAKQAVDDLASVHTALRNAHKSLAAIGAIKPAKHAHGQPSHVGRTGIRAASSEPSSEEQLRQIAEQDRKRIAFFESLRQRRAALEHDMEEHH